MRSPESRGLAVNALLCAALAACGGGGGGSSPTPQSYTIGGTVAGLAAGESVKLADNGADELTVSGNNLFTFAGKINANGGYAVTVTAQPLGQTCAVTSGSGAAVAANVTSVTVTCTNRPQYAYAINNGSDTVSQYVIDAAGTLSPLPVATVPTGHLPESITVDTTHHYVYVTNLGDDTVSQYVIQSDGTLLPNTPATIPAGHGAWASAASAAGGWLYVVNSVDNSISQFSINSSGALVATSNPAVATGVEPWHLTLSPDSRYAYVSDHGSAAPGGMTLHQYAVDPKSGALTALNPATVPTAFPYPGGIAVDPTSAYVYLSNINGKSVSEFAIGTDGALADLNPASVAAGTEPVYLAFDPTGKYAYEANYTVDLASPPGSVSQYTVGTGGQLMPMATPSVAAGNGPAWIAFDAFGKYAFVTNIGNGTQPGTISEYAIGSDGALTPLGSVTAGLSTFMIATTY
jgi:6-phosphogluconolactonase